MSWLHHDPTRVLIHFYSTRTTPTGPEASISLSEMSTAITMRKWPESNNMPYRACEHNNGPPERWSLSESYCNPNQLCKKRLSPHNNTISCITQPVGRQAFMRCSPKRWPKSTSCRTGCCGGRHHCNDKSF